MTVTTASDRIVIKLNIHKENDPELWSFLHKLPVRRRADRLRLLALIGLGQAIPWSTSTTRDSTVPSATSHFPVPASDTAYPMSEQSLTHNTDWSTASSDDFENLMQDVNKIETY